MRVLIADFDQNRSRTLAHAASSRGYSIDRVSHGAAALELALDRLPDVVVCPIDLPVIDGERLAEIVRGNPRTRNASFIYLVKDELDAPMAMSPRDATVVSPWHEEDVLDHIEAFLERSARFGEARSDTEIEGKLTQISLVDLLQIFQMNKRSGTLRIWPAGGGSSGAILVKGGQILDASVPLPDGSSVVAEKALYRLLTWREGRFEFIPGTVGESGRIKKLGRALIMEGIRQLDEWGKLRRLLPADDTRLILKVSREEVPGRDHPLTVDVLDALEAYGRIGAIVDRCKFPDYQALRVIQELLSRELVEIEAHSDTPQSAGGAEGIFSQSQLRRMRDWAGAQQPRSGSVLKVLVAAAGVEQIELFHSGLRECPDFMSDSRLLREPGRMAGICTLGHVSLGDGISLRLIGVPCDPVYSPLWEVAGHGMLGAVVLPRGPYGPALEETEEAFACLRDLRPESVVHVISAGEGGALSDEARAQMAHLEGGSVFVLPEVAGGERLQVLRNVFARLVP